MRGRADARNPNAAPHPTPPLGVGGWVTGCPDHLFGREKPGEACIRSSRSGLGGTFLCFHRPYIHIKQGLALVALILILFPQLDELLEDFYIKTFSLRLCKDFLFQLVQLLQFSVQVLDPLHERTDPSAGNAGV